MVHKKIEVGDCLRASNSKLNKVQNRNTILKMIAQKAPISRIELSKLTGLSKMSLTNIISEFKEEKLVEETGLDSTAKGKRKPVLLELIDGCLCAIGIHITRNYAEGCLADIKGNIMYSKRVDLKPDFDKDWLVDTILDLVRTIKNMGDRRIVGVGVSSMGPLDLEKGVILNPTHFNHVENIPIVEEIKKHFDLPVFLCKNTNCAVLAEKYYGVGKGIENFVYIGVSRGVGSGAVVDDRLITGRNGFACEIGHLTINPKGELCACGNRGCLEQYANIVSAVQKAKDRVKNGEKTILKGEITFETIINAAIDKDPLPSEILDELCSYLAIGIINLINIFDPQLVVVGNDIAMGGNEIIRRLKEYVGTVPIAFKRNKVDIKMSKFYDKAPLLGGATVVFDKLVFA